MSRIQDALKRAEETRAGKPTTPEPAQPQEPSRAEQLNDEVRRLEASINAWRVRSAKADAAEASSPESGAAPAPSAKLDEELYRSQSELNARESRVMQAQQQCASLRAQVAEQERVAAQVGAHLETLRQRLQQAESGMRSAEKERVAQSERLNALRRCQQLAVAAARAEEDLRSHADAMARIARVRQRIEQRLSKHQLQAQQLERVNNELQRQLNEELGKTTETPNE